MTSGSTDTACRCISSNHVGDYGSRLKCVCVFAVGGGLEGRGGVGIYDCLGWNEKRALTQICHSQQSPDTNGAHCLREHKFLTLGVGLQSEDKV